MTYRKSVYIWLAIAVLSAVAMLSAIGVSFARYRTQSTVNLTMNNNYSSGGVWLLSSHNENYDENGEDEETRRKYNELQGWTATDGATYTLSFLLSNENNDSAPAGTDQNAELQIFVTEGIANSSNLSVTLLSGDGVYTATAQPVIEGSTVYNAYGAGWIYKFLNDNGQPITWFLKGQQASELPLTLTVTGEGTKAASLSLIAVGTPAN